MKEIIKSNSILLWLLLGVLIIGLFASCGSKKRVSKHISETQTIERQSDTIYIEKSLLVTDTVFVSVPQIVSVKPECDSLINLELKNALKRLETHKKSGQNSYGFYFDEHKKTLVAYAKLDSTLNSIKKQYTEKENTVFVEKEIIKIETHTPFIIKIFAWLGLLGLGYALYKAFRFFYKI